MNSPVSTSAGNGFSLRPLSRRKSLAILGVVQFAHLPLLTTKVYAQPPAAANQIVPDGRTQTNVQTSGSVTNITTSTVSGTNAFNSFSQFGVGRSNTVNLQLPSGTQNLVNVVTNAPAYVNGTLNSYANGKIGGNVYFVDPKGFAVGETGTVNVGSLNVSTPTKEFTNSLIGAGGQINTSAVSSLMGGSFPVSPDGNIRILGRVNAADGVRLTGQNVSVGSTNQRAEISRDHAMKFSASVNSRGLQSAGSIVVRNGSIQIVASNKASVSGRLVARGRHGAPNNISVAAGKNVDIGKTAKLSVASKKGNAGEVLLKAGGELTIANGASIDASSALGNAGLVDLSANGNFNIGEHIKISLGAPHGTAGTMVLDPTDIVIGDPTQGDTGVTMTNAALTSLINTFVQGGGGYYVISASNSITVDPHGVISSQNLDANGHSQSNAGNIELEAPIINVMQGGQILATPVNSGTHYLAGDIKLIATASDTELSGLASTSTSITVDGTISGANITIAATSNSTSSFTSSIAGDFALVGETLAASFLGLNGGYVAATSNATIAITSNANITGSGNVSITASGTEDAEDPVIATSLAAAAGLGSPFGAAVVVGSINATISNTISSGATVSAGGALSISSTDTDTLAVNAMAVSSTAQFLATVAYGTTSVNTSAIVQGGAHLSSGTAAGGNGGVSVVAYNNNSISVSSTAVGTSPTGASGGVGAAVAISSLNTSATATLSSGLGTSTTKMNGGVQVEATSDTTKNSTSSSVIVGTPALLGAISGAIAGASTGGANFVAKTTTPLFSTDFDFKTSGALSYATGTQSSTASIAQQTGYATPAIYATGDVTVSSNTIDESIRNNASSSAISTDPSTGESYSIAAAVAYASLTHNANAFIGDNVTINANRIGVESNVSLPNTNTWTQWNSLSDVLSHLNSNFGVVSNIITSYANATADGGDELGLAGAVSYFSVTNNSTAWVGSGANLTSTSTSSATWTTNFANGDSQTWQTTLNVVAATTSTSIDIAGNFGALGLLNGVGSGGSAAGGSLNYVTTASNTFAGVASGASLTSAVAVDVDATTTDFIFGLTPSSGSAAGALALSGIASVLLIDNTTHASISNDATVSAPSLNIDAAQNVSLITGAGALDLGANSAVGIAVAYLGASGDTAAFIGDNHADIAQGAFSSDDPGAASSNSGSISADSVSVLATTSGRLTAGAVAAAETDPSGAPSFTSKASALYSGSGSSASGGQNAAATGQSAIADASGDSDEINIDIAGSSSISKVGLNTTAYVSGATIGRFTPTSTTANVLVQAISDTILDNGSGSAGLNIAGNDSPMSGAIAGAIAIGIANSATTAYIHNTTLSNESSVSVQALDGGSETVVAIALAVSTNSNAAAISASIGLITDSATAYISGGTLNGLSSGTSRSVEVDAYQSSNIAIGGGSLYVSGGTVGAGVALTYAQIADPTNGSAVAAYISGTPISGYDTFTVLADDSSVIAAGAASGGLGGNGLAAAIVVDSITPTTTAYITSSYNVTINVTGAVTVTADSVDVASLDNSLNNLVKKNNNNNTATDNCSSGGTTQACVDFSGAALNGGTGNAAGAGIISVAGIIQAGKNNVGAAMVFDTIASTHSAYISDVLLTSTAGDVAVTARDSSKIQSVTIGFGLATGQFAGTAGTTISSIENTVSASVGDSRSTTTNSTVSADDLDVIAADTSTIIGTAAVGGASTQGAAAGLSIVYSNIANNVSAALTGTLVTASGDVAVTASSTATISTVAVGIAISGRFGLAGSVATNLMGSNVTADITGGADVTANNNVSVLASNSDNVAVFAGAFSIAGGAGGGAGSLTTNDITGATSAYISGSTTKVDALGGSSTDMLSVNSGTLAHAIDLGDFSAPTDNTPNLAETQDTLTGLAVVASSHQAVVTNVASLAASSGVAIMVNAIVNVMSGTTSAYIDSASIDTRLTSATPLPKIDVAASSFSYSGAFGLGIVASTTGGGGATIISTTMERTTDAYMTNAKVGNTASPDIGAITVKSNAEQDASSVAVGFNSGSVGLNVFNATTEAYVKGGTVTGVSLTVNAQDSTGIASADGSGAYGSAAAIGAAFLVQVSENTTEAYIGDSSTSSPVATTVNLTGALDVEANTTDNFQAYSVGGALSTGTFAIAGMANIEIAHNTTLAGLYNTTVQSPTAGAAGAVTVQSTENVTIDEIAGALAVGLNGSGVGVGAAANVLVFMSNTTAESINSNIDSSGVVNVNATSTKEVQSYAVTAGVGGSVGIGAAVSVVIIGNNDADSGTQSDESNQLNSGGTGTLSAVNAGSNSSQGSTAVASGMAGNPSNANVTSTYDVSNALAGGSDGVTAQITGGHVTASEVDVGATSQTATTLFLLGAGFGKNAGIGAGIGYTTIDSNVLANLQASVTAPNVSVVATVQDPTTGTYSGSTVNTTAIAGGLALYFGADAAVAEGDVSNHVTAEIGGSITNPGTGGVGVILSATDTSTQSATAGGGSGGIAAIGVSIAQTEKSSTITAKVLEGSTITSNNLLISATDAGSVSAEAVAVAGGVVAGDGAVATANDNSTLLAEIGSGSGNITTITTSASGLGTIVNATATPDISSSAIGVAVGGVGLGVSYATADSTLHVTADVGDNAVFSGGDLAISASALVPTANGGHTTYASSIAGGGGSLLGLQGSYAEASETSTVMAYGGTGITLPSADVLINAENDSNQYATATGIAVGYVAAGATVTQTSSNATTQAYLGAGAVTASTNTGVLQILATGTDSNVATSTAGSGGVVAGAAAVATTSSTATTAATLYGDGTTDTLYFGGLNVMATHTTNYAATGNAFQASVAGASGGGAGNSVTSTTTAEVGTNMIINSAAGDMDVIANDLVNQTSGGATAGSGGVAAGAATISQTTVTQIVTANVDSGTIFSLNDDPLTSNAKINIEAYNTVNTTDSTNLTAAGLFAGGGAESDMTATATLTVNVNATELFSAGNIDIGTASQMNTANYANANLYGVVTGAGASSNSTAKSTQTVNIGGASTIEAWGVITIDAGQAGDGSVYSSVIATATTEVYNYALVPISAQYSGSATAWDNTSLNIAAGAQILGANNIFLGATPDGVSAPGTGTNHNPYLSAFSTANYDNHSDPESSGAVSLNGIVVAGIHNQETITIGLGSITPVLTPTTYGLTLENVSDPTQFSPVVSYNHQALQYAVIGAFNPYQDIVSQLATLSGLTTAQVQTILSQNGTQSVITAINDDAAGDVQREINTLIQQAPYATNASGQALAFGNILVSEGNVQINAQTLTGTAVAGLAAPSVSAQSGAKIDIENNGLLFTDLQQMTVSGVTGGAIKFTGSASSSTSTGITYNSQVAGTPLIEVNANYNVLSHTTGLPVDSNGNPLTTTPDLYFSGLVSNFNGLFSITDAIGNVVTTQSFNAATISVTVPNGSFTAGGGAGSIFNSYSYVPSQWSTTEFRPMDTLTAVEAAATYLGTYPSYSNGGAYLNGNASYSPYFYYSDGTGFNHTPVTSYSNASTVFTARLLALAYNGGPTLYSAIFLPVSTTSSNLANAGLPSVENTSSSNITLSGWERGDFQGQAYSASDSGPFDCSGCGNYFQVVNIQNAAVTPITQAVANPVSGLTAANISAGKAVILSASVLNINGAINSGNSSNYSVNIGTATTNAINNLLHGTGTETLAQAQAAAAKGDYYDLTSSLATVNPGDTKLSAQYDVLTNQIILNGVVQGSGGYVYLNGKIISTSTDGTNQGSITVNGGAGTITVNNNTNFDLVTNTINTGVSSASVIEIVDQSKQQTTWYVYNAAAQGGQQVSTYRANGVNVAAYTPSMYVGSSGPSGLQYTPLANQYLQWVDTATLARTLSGDATTYATEYGWNFTSGSANSPTGPYVQTVSLVNNVQQVANGVTTGQLQSANYQEVVTATGSYYLNSESWSSGKPYGTDFNGTWNQEIYTNLTLTLTNTVKASYPINISFNGGGASSVVVNSNHSNIVVDGPINNLQGTTSLSAGGTITVGSSANNPIVTGTSVTLHAPGGIGTPAVPLPIQAYGGTLTATTGTGNIALAAIGSLAINQVNAGTGNVYLSATGDITSASSYSTNTPIVIGDSITIDSSAGAIGATSSTSGGVTVLSNLNPLVIQATGTVLPDSSVDGGLLNSTSSTGTYIVQSKGDLRLGTVSSLSGPVLLEAAASDGNPANIINGVSSGGLTAAQSAHLASVWTSLELASGSGAAAVNSYESMVNAAYADYWQLRNIAFADGSTYNLTALGTVALTAQVAAAQGIAPSAVTPAMLQTAATTRFEKDEFILGIVPASQLPDTLTTLFGANLAGNQYLQAAPSTTALTAALSAYNPTFSYVLAPTTALYASITSGSQWTQDQLNYTVSAAAQPNSGVSPATIQSLPLNVSGRQVILYAPDGSIGSLAPTQTFSFTSVDSSSLTTAQKGLLASAGPGQLSVSQTTDSQGVITYTVSVTEQSLVIVSPLGPVSAKALSQVYLGSATDLLLGGIPTSVFGPVTAAQSLGVQTISGGNVKLQAVDSILEGVAGQVAISGNITDLTLIAETGNIGLAPAAGTNPAANQNALQLALTGSPTGVLDQASAGLGIYLNQTNGDLILGNVSAVGAIQLAASGSIYAEPAFAVGFVHITGGSLDLRAGGNVSFNGTTFQPLQVQIAGAVTGSSVGQMSILSPNSDLNVGAAGTYGVLTSGGALTLDTTLGNLNINADVTSAGLMQLLASGAVTFAAGTNVAPVVAADTSGGVTLVSASLSMGAYSAIDATGAISVTTTGDATLGQLNTTYNPVSVGAAITVVAGGVTTGAILSNGDGQTNLVAMGANDEISLNGSSIGTSTSRVSINTPLLTSTATSGGMYLSALGDLEASLLSATKGSIDVVGSGRLTLDSVMAGTATNASGTFSAKTLTASDGLITIATAVSNGTISVNSAGDLKFTQLTTTNNGDIELTAAAGLIQGGSLSAYGSASLIADGTNTGDSLTTVTGSAILQSSVAMQWTTLNVGTTLNAAVTGGTVSSPTQVVSAGGTSYSFSAGNTIADSITFGTAQSGGTQTLHADDNVTFNRLTTTGVGNDPGDVTVNADHGFVLAQTVTVNGVATEGSVAAHGSASLTASTTNTGNTLTAATGSASLMAGGLIDWNSLTAATTLGVTSTNDSITFGTTQSGGTQTLHANDNVTFNQLTTTGVGNDPGDVTVNADHGFVLAQTVTVNGVATEGSVAAHGSASLTASTTNTGNTLTAATGSASLMAGGLIDWNSLTAATTLGVTSTNDSIQLGSTQSGGSQTLHANQNVTFNQIEATGVGNDPGDVTVNADHGFVLAQTVTVNGVATEGSVAAHGSASLTSATTNTGNTLTAATGSASLMAGGLIDWNSLTAATTLGLTSTNDSIQLGSTQSGGSQTLHANDNVTFNQLTTTGVGNDPGDLTVNADHGFVLAQTVTVNGVATEGSVAAHGSASLTSATTNTGNTLTAATGSASLMAGGLIDWNSLTVATTLGVTSTNDSIQLGSTQSGGSQTLHANDNVTFNQLTTTGVGNDPGDVTVNADHGFVLAQTVNGVATEGSVAAHGSASLTSATTNTGNTLTAATGSASLMAGGLIDWNSLTAATTLGVTSTGGAIMLNTATSGGTQTLHAANDIVFTQLTTTGIPGDAGDINLRSDLGAARGGSISANGNVAIGAAGSIDLNQVRGSRVALSAPDDINVRFASVAKELDLAANTIELTGAQIPSNPVIPLILDVNGFNDGIATSASLVIAASSIVANQYKVVDSTFFANTPSISIVSGLVPGQLMLTTPTEFVLVNDRSPAPSSWATIQLYQPGGAFTMSQNNNVNFTDAYVVFYTGDIASTVATYSPSHACCNDFSGSSFVRNVPTDTQGTETSSSWLAQKTGTETFYLLGLSGGVRIDGLQLPKPIEAVGSGPAVNVLGISELKKFRWLERHAGSKANRRIGAAGEVGRKKNRGLQRVADGR